MTPHNIIHSLEAARDTLAKTATAGDTTVAGTLAGLETSIAELKGAPGSPIKSGWRGEINGCLERTKGSSIEVSEITLKLDRETAYALANLLADSSIERSCAVGRDQAAVMSNLGAALGRMLDHPAANNGGREMVK